MPDEWLKPTLSAERVSALVATQFPHWRDLPVRPVATDGWDNTSFRLGDELLVRLPSHRAYAAQVEKEQTWLPRLARHLPLPIPEPIAKGVPSDDYPLPWSVYRWLDGVPATGAHIADKVQFAEHLGQFLGALQKIDTRDGPPPGRHNFFRGGELAVYDEQTRETLTKVPVRVDGALVADIWETALSSQWVDAPVWVHGDVAPGNLLVDDGELCAVIDFGCSCVGDPACDLVIAWTFFEGDSREAFRNIIASDEATWARARGWALWKALITFDKDVAAQHVIDAVIAEHRLLV